MQPLLLFLALTSALVPGGREPTPEIAVDWDVASARAVLSVLRQPEIEEDALLEVAGLEGNRALIAKMAQNRPDVTERTFVEALLRARAGETWREDPFFFWHVLRRHAELEAYLDDLTDRGGELDRRFTERLRRFVPEDFGLNATVRVVVGGASAGWTTGNGELNLSLHHYLQDPPETLEMTAAHEVFHVAQESLMPYTASQLEDRPLAIAETFVIQLVREGTASLLDDPDQTELDGEMLERDRLKKKRNREHLASIFLLYENLMFRVVHDPDADLNANYALGFLNGDVPAYTVGMRMAEAVIAKDGDAGLVRLLQEPPAAFVRRYIAISEAPGATDPRFGAAFKAIIDQLP
jgi:hypothetical protein